MFKQSLCGVSALAMAGCASVPSFDAPNDESDRPTVKTIIDKIECEIAEARDAENQSGRGLENFKPFGHWTTAVTLTLTVDDTAGTATGGLPLTFIHPFAAAATSFGFGFSPTLYQLRTRTYTQSYTIDISAIPDHLTCAEMMKRPGNYNLEGDLGLKDQIYMGLHSFDRAQHGADYYATADATVSHPAAKTPDTFGATVSFNVYYGINNVAPNWTLVKFKGPTAGFGYVRNDLHQIVMTFAPALIPSKILAQKKPEPIAPFTKEPPPVPVKKGVLLGERPENPATKFGAKIDSEDFKKAATLYENYQAEERAYNTEVQAYSSKVLAYASEVAAHQAKVLKYNAELTAYTQAQSTASSADTARNVNQAAVTNQAIQNLGQILSRP